VTTQTPGPGYYPYQAGIDAYGAGGFRFADMSHRGSILCLPNGMHAWSADAAAEVTLQSLLPILDLAGDIDVLLIGMGEDIAALDLEISRTLRDAKIIAEAVSTGSAVRTYNVLFAERRAVAAALIAVERRD
jgi:uncharacterized protein